MVKYSEIICKNIQKHTIDLCRVEESGSDMSKILIVGPNFFGYNESVGYALKEKGHIVQVFNHYDGYKGIKNKVLCSKLSKLNITKFKDEYDQKLNREILDVYNNFNPDVVLVIKGFQMLPSTLEKMNKSIKVLWMMDSVYRYENVLKNINLYDYRFMFENKDVEKLKQEGILSYFLPLAADKNKYFPKNETTKDIDILFIGSLYESRKEMFERLSKDFENLNICVYGKYTDIKKPISYVKYMNKDIKRIFKNSYVDSSEVNDLYSRAKICINLHHEQSKDGCNPRFYEILASGAFQIVDYNEYIIKNYGNKVDNFKTYDELKSKIEFYLANEEERKKSILNYKEIVEENYFENRVDTLLDIIKL